MAFTKLPRQVAAFTQTKHTELVAVLGKFKRDSYIRVGTAGSELYYAIGDSYSWDPAAIQPTSVWVWGDSNDCREEKRKGRLFAVRDDGLIVTEGEKRSSEVFDVWRGKKRLKSIPSPDFGSYVATGQFIHDRLCLTSAVEGIVVIDVDEGKRVHTMLAPPPQDPDDDDYDDEKEAKYSIAPAPNRGIAVSDGDRIAVFSLDTGRLRKQVKVPADLETRTIAVSPDGAYVVADTVVKKKWTVGSTGFAVFDLKKRRFVKKLTGHKPYVCNGVFVDGGRVLATTSTDRTVRLWRVGEWKLLEVIKLQGAADDPSQIEAWDSRQAMILTGERGVAYVFSVSAESIAKKATEESSTKKKPSRTKTTSGKPKKAKTAKKKRVAKRLPKAKWPELGCVFKLSTRGADQFGGVPAGFSAQTWPVCRDCEQPMLSALTLYAHPERLPLRAHEAISVFLCQSCETWQPYGGANAAVLLTKEQLEQKLRKPPAGLEGATEVLKRRRLAYRPETQLPQDDYRVLDKVGGKPDWLQTDQTPKCRECKSKMNFVAQFSDSLDPWLNFGIGIGYVFVCPHEHDARFLWQR